jgi:hypothetical protein
MNVFSTINRFQNMSFLNVDYLLDKIGKQAFNEHVGLDNFLCGWWNGGQPLRPINL